MIEKIDPQHQAIVGVETLSHLGGDLIHIADQGIVRGLFDLLRIDRAIERIPIGTEGAIRLLLGRGASLLIRKAGFVIEKDHRSARHIGPLPSATRGVETLSHTLVGRFDHLRPCYREIEHLYG